jgi:hypothetical protein
VRAAPRWGPTRSFDKSTEIDALMDFCLAERAQREPRLN